MRIGYSAWGFVGEGVIDSPDGGRITRALFLSRLIDKGYDVVWLQKNRDLDQYDKPLFCKKNKTNIYYINDPQKVSLCDLQYTNAIFPEIDVLFLEWRWPIYGRNCLALGENPTREYYKNYTPDLDRQIELILYYTNLHEKCPKIVIWDKDNTMTKQDEAFIGTRMTLQDNSSLNWNKVTIFSPALFPEKHIFNRHTLHFPCDLQKIKEAKVVKSFDYLIGYVGSQYDRDEQVYKYINPFSFKNPQKVVFAGNWTKYKEKTIHNLVNFPAIRFVDRILPSEMGKIYSKSLTSVLLCRPSYSETGHITQRIHEVASHGVIAIGLKEQKGIEQFILKDNIISDAYELEKCIERLKFLSIDKRQDILNQQIEMLELFDINNVIKKFEDTIGIKE